MFARVASLSPCSFQVQGCRQGQSFEQPGALSQCQIPFKGLGSVPSSQLNKSMQNDRDFYEPAAEALTVQSARNSFAGPKHFIALLVLSIPGSFTVAASSLMTGTLMCDGDLQSEAHFLPCPAARHSCSVTIFLSLYSLQTNIISDWQTSLCACCSCSLCRQRLRSATCAVTLYVCIVRVRHGLSSCTLSFA